MLIDMSMSKKMKIKWKKTKKHEVYKNKYVQMYTDQPKKAWWILANVVMEYAHAIREINLLIERSGPSLYSGHQFTSFFGRIMLLNLHLAKWRNPRSNAWLNQSSIFFK